MFDFEKPKIEIAEISEDKKYGGQFFEENYVVFLTGSSGKPDKN